MCTVIQLLAVETWCSKAVCARDASQHPNAPVSSGGTAVTVPGHSDPEQEHLPVWSQSLPLTSDLR